MAQYPVNTSQVYGTLLDDLQKQLAASYREYARVLSSFVVASTADAQVKEAYRVATNVRYDAYRREVLGIEFERARLNTVVKRQADLGISRMVNLSMRDILANAQYGAKHETADSLGLIAKTYNKAIDQRWREVIGINRKVADRAIQDMLIRYDKVRKRSTIGSYREGDRFAGGVLRAALANPSQATVTIDGVAFLNPELLDESAKQWARLNFGAGARANKGDGKAAVGGTVTTEFLSTALGETLPTFSIDLPYGPGDAFTMPRGIFSSSTGGLSAASRSVVPYDANNRGQHAFYALSTDKEVAKIVKAGGNGAIMTAGVAAWGFIEAGVASLARNLPAANSSFMQRILEETQQDAAAGIAGKFFAPDMTTVNNSVKILADDTARFIRGEGNIAKSRINFLNSL